jgi:hypothetical protein
VALRPGLPTPGDGGSEANPLLKGNGAGVLIAKPAGVNDGPAHLPPLSGYFTTVANTCQGVRPQVCSVTGLDPNRNARSG